MDRYRHEAVSHGVGEFVKGKVHTNSVENAWSLLKRAHHGTYHRVSPNHLHRYITEFEGRYNWSCPGLVDSLCLGNQAASRYLFSKLTGDRCPMPEWRRWGLYQPSM